MQAAVSAGSENRTENEVVRVPQTKMGKPVDGHGRWSPEPEHGDNEIDRTTVVEMVRSISPSV